MYVIKCFCIGLVSDFLQANCSQWEGPFIIEEVYRSGAIKINSLDGDKPQGANGQRLKHYISGNPLEKYADVIQVVPPEEFIETKFWKTPESGNK